MAVKRLLHARGRFLGREPVSNPLAGLGSIIDASGGEPRYPRVAAYCERLFARQSVRRAVIDWPMHPPSEHLPEFYPAALQG